MNPRPSNVRIYAFTREQVNEVHAALAELNEFPPVISLAMRARENSFSAAPE
jgi:hypothetical protein